MKLIHVAIIISIAIVSCEDDVKKRQKALLVKKHLKRLKKLDGAIKLVGGKGEFEGKFSV